MKIRKKLSLAIGALAFMIFIAMYISVNIVEKTLSKNIGENAALLAQGTIDDVDRNIFHRAESIQAKTKDLVLLETVINSNTAFEGLEDSEAYINEQEKQWRAAPKEILTPFMEKLVTNKLSQELNELIQFYNNQHKYPSFGEILVTNKFGANVGMSTKTTDYYQADEEWWQKAKEEEFYIGDIHLDESSNAYGLELSLPIKDDKGNFIGALKAVLDIRDTFHILDPVIESARIADNQILEFKLLTHDRKIIYATEDYVIFSEFPEVLANKIQNSFKSTKNANYFIAQGDKAEEGEELFAFATSKGHRGYKGLGWILVVEEETEELFAPVMQLRNVLFVISSIIILLAIFFGLLFSRGISSPLIQLRNIAEKFAKGDLSVKAKIKTKDEIGDLANVFNKMGTDLMKSKKEIEQYTSDLEKIVQERTKDLEKEKESAEKISSFAINRELKMVELKKEIKALKKKKK